MNVILLSTIFLAMIAAIVFEVTIHKSNSRFKLAFKFNGGKFMKNFILLICMVGMGASGVSNK